MWTMLRDGWEKDKRRKGGERKAGTDGWKKGCVGYLKVCIVLDGWFFNTSSFFFNVVKKLENNFHKPKIQEWTYSRVTQFEAQDGVIIICSVYVVVLWILFSHVLATLKKATGFVWCQSISAWQRQVDWSGHSYWEPRHDQLLSYFGTQGYTARLL